MKQCEFSFDSEDFAGMRYVINEELSNVIRQMKSKDLPSGSVTVKISIGKMETADENGEIRQMFVFDPNIQSKVGKKFKAKCHAIGGVIRIGRNGELLVGPSDQMTIDELMAEKEGA